MKRTGFVARCGPALGPVVVKSINETAAGRDQLQRAEYLILDDQWRPIPWGSDAPPTDFVACRSGLMPLRSLEQNVGWAITG